MDNWGRYPSEREAGLACDEAVKKGPSVHVPGTYGGAEYERHVRTCRLRDNHWELSEKEVKEYQTWNQWNSAKSKTIRRFYF